MLQRKRRLDAVHISLLRAGDLDRENFFECESFACGFGVGMFLGLVYPHERGRKFRQVILLADFRGDRVFECAVHACRKHSFECMEEPSTRDAAALRIHRKYFWRFCRRVLFEESFGHHVHRDRFDLGIGDIRPLGATADRTRDLHWRILWDV